MCQNSILERIKKLLEMTEENGCSAQEAASALALAQKLMAQHELSSSDFEGMVFQEVEEVAISCGTKTVSSLQCMLALGLADHFACAVIKRRTHEGTCLIFIGDSVKVKVFEEAFLFSLRQFQALWTKYHKTLGADSKKSEYRGAYFRGFLKGIQDELTRSENINALVLVKSQAVEDRVQEITSGHTSRVQIRHNFSAHAFDKGYSDGVFSQRNQHRVIS